MRSAEVLLAVAFEIFKVELKIGLFVPRIGYIDFNVVFQQGIDQLSNGVALVMEVRAQEK